MVNSKVVQLQYTELESIISKYLLFAAKTNRRRHAYSANPLITVDKSHKWGRQSLFDQSVPS